MRGAARLASVLAALAAPVAAQPLIDGPILTDDPDLAVIAPRCAGLMLVIAAQDPVPEAQGAFLAFVGRTAGTRAAAGLPAEQADVRAAVIGYAEAYVAAVQAGALTNEGFDVDRSYCMAAAASIWEPPSDDHPETD